MHRRRPNLAHLLLFYVLCVALAAAPALGRAAVSGPKDPAVAKRLAGFDAWMKKAVDEWNVPGIGVAIAVGDQVVLAQGWGYRDFGQKLPFTVQTTVPIASNTKLFTAVAAGMQPTSGV